MALCFEVMDKSTQSHELERAQVPQHQVKISVSIVKY